MDNLTNKMHDYIKSFVKKQLGNDDFTLDISALFGDGSDRKYYRIGFDGETLIFANNAGAVKLDAVCENDSFDYICRHLKSAGVLTPKIYDYSKSDGWFILEDLGDETLFMKATANGATPEIEELYRRALDTLLTMQTEGIKGFDQNMCYATKYYDKELILEYESGYFFREFINCYLKLDLKRDDLRDEFEHLAEEAMKNTGKFFLHRDYQARNIMLQNDELRIIDFQGGRVGPLQYDLATLVIDAFVNLPYDMRDRLWDHYLDNLEKKMEFDRDDFKKRLYYTAAHRTMQALGAYAFLTLKKGKTHFEPHMGKAVHNLKIYLDRAGADKTAPKLKAIVDRADEELQNKRVRGV